MAGAREVKPAPPKWLKPNADIYNATDASAVKIDIEKMMELMEQFRHVQTEEDLSDCIHVINPDRMVDMGGCTFMRARYEDSLKPLLSPCVITRTTA